MTREERAKSLSSHLLIAAARLRRSEITRDEYDSIARAKIESFADAEAAAMRERAAGACEANKYGDIAHDHETRMCDDVCDECAAAIRALPATGEVGRG